MNKKHSLLLLSFTFSSQGDGGGTEKRREKVFSFHLGIFFDLSSSTQSLFPPPPLSSVLPPSFPGDGKTRKLPTLYVQYRYAYMAQVI